MMKDRIPQYPGRVKMTLPDGSFKYITLERADEAVEAGTPLNKSTLLTDETAAALGLNPAANPTVNDALLQTLANVAAMAATIPSDPEIQKLIDSAVVAHNQATAAHSDIRSSISSVQGTLQGNIDKVNSTLTGSINSVNTTLSANINKVKSTLDNKINTVNSDLLARINAANATISGMTKSAFGSYVGTGTWSGWEGEDAAKTTILNFPFAPTLLFLLEPNTGIFAFHCMSPLIGEDGSGYWMTRGGDSNNSLYIIYAYWRNDGKTFQGAATSAKAQCNKEGTTYFYIALG